MIVKDKGLWILTFIMLGLFAPVGLILLSKALWRWSSRLEKEENEGLGQKD